MNSISLYSNTVGEIEKFLKLYSSIDFNLENKQNFKQEFQNPIDMIDFMSCFIDNNNKFKISMWISIDKDIYIKINDYNLNTIIKYIYERYPW